MVASFSWVPLNMEVGKEWRLGRHFDYMLWESQRVRWLPHPLNQNQVQSWPFRCVFFNMDVFWVIGPAGLKTSLFSVLLPSKGTLDMWLLSNLGPQELGQPGHPGLALCFVLKIHTLPCLPPKANCL